MSGNLNARSPLLWIGMIAFVIMSLLCLINIRYLVAGTSANPALTLTSVMMVGLTLIVALVILLLLFFKATDTDDKSQALALPSGSIRALIALALILMFVCLGVYLYHGVSDSGPEVTKQGLTQAQVEALKNQVNFVVQLQEPQAQGATTSPLFDVTYFVGHSKEADDLAKQMFTQLATVFITVIGFYFGSSTAASGVGVGVAAASTTKTPGPLSAVPAALQDVKAMAHDADLDLARIQAALGQIAAESDRGAVEALLSDTQKTVDTIHAKVQAAMTAAAKFGTLGSDAENDAAAADVIKARDEIKPLATAVKASADKVQGLVSKSTS